MAAAAQPAAALSCLVPDPIRSFAEIDAAPEIYRAYVGRFAFDASKLPRSDAAANVSTSPEPIPADFTGHQLGPTGFDTEIETAMILQPSCAGPWCGALVPGKEVLVFARVEEGRLIVDLEPCPGTVQAAPDAAMRERLAACLRGEACAPAE
ncbi:hypothetical protein [Limimaricola litoreus]|uniref:Uncharacterized protein n=1 Tax=Limimaricola litoreus TaxID=2955316 RepID=A0A9X2FPF5_9RHOB|nr:hypothetical protein [Limimaricola litoreus]MCP1167440.1 hypothetical protein [Limimaricola litoreus]